MRGQQTTLLKFIEGTADDSIKIHTVTDNATWVSAWQDIIDNPQKHFNVLEIGASFSITSNPTGVVQTNALIRSVAPTGAIEFKITSTNGTIVGMNACVSVENIDIDNTGTTLATLQVRGGPWVDTIGATQMLVESTAYATLTDPAPKTSLTLSDVTIPGGIDPALNLDTFWQLTANLIDTAFAGSLTQTVDFTVTC